MSINRSESLTLQTSPTKEKKTDIMPGDILVFKVVENNLSKCIAKLTNSDVTHAAMVYEVPTEYDNGILVEMIPQGINMTEFRVDKSSTYDIGADEVYLLRLKEMLCCNCKLSVEPLKIAAEKYVNENDSFDFELLMFLSSLLVYKELPHTCESANIALIILRYTHKVLDKLLNDKENDERMQMCSQLVYQIFWDSGNKYALNTKPFLLENTQINTKKDLNKNSIFIRLCDLANKIKLDDQTKNKYMNQQLFLDRSEKITWEEFENFINELYEALDKLDEVHEDCCDNLEDWTELAVVTEQFIKKREQLFKKLHKNTPIDALFVTPADILYNTENLEQRQIIKIFRYL